ncbi:hypothetical protein JCM8097_007989 [Rhodosporidiobolus ruineniae]
MSTALHKRVLPSYTYVDGAWVEGHEWTLRGSAATTPTSASSFVTRGGADDVDAVAEPAATAMEDNLASSSLSPSSTARSASSRSLLLPSPSRSSSSSIAQPAVVAHANSAQTTSVNIPDGWQPKERETDFYAVPIIVAMSILVALMVVGAIFGTMMVRRKKRRRERRHRARKGLAPVEEEEKRWRKVVDKVVPGRRKRVRERERAEGDRPAGEEGGEGEGREGRGSGGGSGGGHRRVRTTGFAAGPRVRPRRRRRRGGEADDEDDEGTALTRTQTRSSTSSAGGRDTLTQRLAARMRGEGAAAREGRATGAATVFSRDVNAGSVVSLTASALSRAASASESRTTVGRTLSGSGSSPATPTTPTTPALPPHLLFTPADDPALQAQPHIPGSPSLALQRSHSRASSRSSLALPPAALPASSPPQPTPPPPSSFGLLIASDALPAPGPPAYRASSSRVQQTRRFGAGDREVLVSPVLPALEQPARRRLVGGFGGRRRERGREEQEGEGEEEQWHWPGEKGRALAPSSPVAGPSAPPVEEDDPTEAEERDAAEEEEEEAHDPALYSAHVATDDKAVLARLRAQTDRFPASSAAMASAPPVELDGDDEADEDGFERLPAELLPSAGPSTASSSSTVAMNTPTSPSSLLPAPPSRVMYSYFSSSSASASASGSGSTSSFALAGPSPALSTTSRAPLLASTSTSSRSGLTPLPTAGEEKSALAREYAAAGLGQEDEEEGDEEEGDDGPSYLPRYAAGGAPMASAPPLAESDDEEDDDGEGELDEALRRSEEGVVAEREEHAVV